MKRLLPAIGVALLAPALLGWVFMFRGGTGGGTPAQGLLLVNTNNTSNCILTVTNLSGCVLIGNGVGSTLAGVPLPPGYALQRLDTFGTNTTQSIQNDTQLHALYNEGLQYNTTGDGLVLSSNVVINNQQQTFVHFGSAEQFFSDHLEIQARGQVGGAINSEELVAKFIPRSFCIEAKLTEPSPQGSWPIFSQIGYASPNLSASEIDFEGPVSVGGSPNTVNNVTLNNHPSFGTLQYTNPSFTAGTALYTPSPSIDFSAAPHNYTSCYDDVANTITRWVDGVKVYGVSGFTWSGPNANAVLALQAGNSSGGTFPGTIASPATFSANMDLYSVAYYTPYGGLPAVTSKQNISHYCGDGPLTTCNVTVSGVAQGDGVVLSLAWTSAANITSITDSFGSTCKQAAGADGHANANGLLVSIWYCQSLSGSGCDIFTVTMSAGVNSLYVQGSETTPIGADEQLGNLASGTTGTNASYPIISTAGPTTHANDFIFSTIAIGSGSTCTGSAYLTTTTSGAYSLSGYMTANAKAAYTTGFGCNSGLAYSMATAAFNP